MIFFFNMYCVQKSSNNNTIDNTIEIERKCKGENRKRRTNRALKKKREKFVCQCVKPYDIKIYEKTKPNFYMLGKFVFILSKIQIIYCNSLS